MTSDIPAFGIMSCNATAIP